MLAEIISTTQHFHFFADRIRLLKKNDSNHYCKTILNLDTLNYPAQLVRSMGFGFPQASEWAGWTGNNKGFMTWCMSVEVLDTSTDW